MRVELAMFQDFVTVVAFFWFHLTVLFMFVYQILLTLKHFTMPTAHLTKVLISRIFLQLCGNPSHVTLSPTLEPLLHIYHTCSCSWHMPLHEV